MKNVLLDSSVSRTFTCQQTRRRRIILPDSTTGSLLTFQKRTVFLKELHGLPPCKAFSPVNLVRWCISPLQYRELFVWRLNALHLLDHAACSDQTIQLLKATQPHAHISLRRCHLLEVSPGYFFSRIPRLPSVSQLSFLFYEKNTCLYLSYCSVIKPCRSRSCFRLVADEFLGCKRNGLPFILPFF